MSVSRNTAKKLIGKHVYAIKKDGSVVDGRLVQIKGNRLYLRPKRGTVRTKAIIPLVLFDLLAIGTFPYGGYPYYGYGYPGYGYPYGYY